MAAKFFDPDLERGRAAVRPLQPVRAAGGSALDATLKAIEVAFDERARQRTLAERAAQRTERSAP